MVTDGKIQLEIVTPARKILSQAVDEVQAPGADGSFGVRPGHTPFIAALRAGHLVATGGGQKLDFAVGEGFVQVSGNQVLVLTEAAERAEDIDLAKAKGEVAAETSKLKGLQESDPVYAVQRAKVELAAARVFVATRK
jgi:F-type H+-transporting ATPase subunit epsilon